MVANVRFLRQMACVAVLAWPVIRAAADPVISGPDQAQVDAYTAVIHGDQARDRGDGKKAVRYYRDAESFYKSLSVDYPQWHPDIVRYRLTYCENEIASIVSKSGLAEAEFLAVPDVEEPASTNEVDPRVDKLVSENEALRAEVARLNVALRDEVAGLQSRLAGMSNQLSRSSPGNQERVEALKTENTKLAAELEKAKKHAGALRETVDLQEKELEKIDEYRARADALKVEKDRLYAEMKKARDELDHALQENRVKKLEALVTNLRAEVKAARDEEDKLRERIAALEKENAGLKRK